MKKFGEILAIIGGLAGLLGIWFSYQTFMHDAGGELTAWHQQRELHNNTTRTVFVCLDDINTDLSSLQVTPIFDNSSKYSIKDFALSYTVESANVVCEPTGFYTKIDYNAGKSVFRYNFETLKPYTDTEPPFRNFKVRSRQARCMIETKATYDGADYPYVYNMDVWFLVVDRKNISEENWRLSCKKAIFDIVEDKEYDIYYYGGGTKDYVFDVNLANIIAEDIEDRKEAEKEIEKNEEKELPVERKLEVKKEDSPKIKEKSKSAVSRQKNTDETYIPKSTDIMPFAMREVNIVSFEFIEGEEGKPSVIRVNYDPSEQEAWAVFAWKYRARNGSVDYGTRSMYIARNSSSCDIEIYGKVKSVKSVVQAVADPSLESVIVEEDPDREGYVKFINPNNKLICAYRYDREKNQVWHTTVKWKGSRSIRFTDETATRESLVSAYETYLIPIKYSRLRHLLFVFCMIVSFLATVVMFVVTYNFVEGLVKEIKTYGWGALDLEKVLPLLFMVVGCISCAGLLFICVFG